MTWSERVKSPAFQLGVKQHRVTLDLAEMLAAAMKARGMKASQLAEKLGKSRAWISKFLHGGRNTTFFTAVEIADALGLDIEVRLVERDAAAKLPEGKTRRETPVPLPRAP